MFDVLAFSGGGTRCLWQGGFLHEVSKIWPCPKHILAVSAGALSAVSYLVDNGETVRAAMKESFQSIDHNLRWGAVLNEKAIAPHLRAYRQALEQAFGDRDIKKLHERPTLNVLLTRPPRVLPLKLASVIGVCAYQLDLFLRGTPHSIIASNLGFRPIWVKANDIASTSDLCELLIAAGCIPPVIPLQQWQQAPVLDGGLIDNAPIEAWENEHGKYGRTLILLTRRYRQLPKEDNRVYVQPSRPIPASKLDFTDPDQVDEAYALGKSDGERFRKHIQNGASPKRAAQIFTDR